MSDTLLSYTFLASPTPLQAGTAATLTLVVSNGSRQIVQATSIVVTLPVGTNARDLVADPSGIGLTVPGGWSGAQDGGKFTLTPGAADAGQVGAQGLVFVFDDVRVNDQPGTTLVGIDETATFEGGTAVERSTDVPLSKFPEQFQVSDLAADPLSVDAGGTVTLQWTGTPATYRMQYSPGNGPAVDVSVGDTGPYVSQPLSRTPNVVFTLVASVAVPGQDQPLTVERQLAVDVRALSIDRFDALPSITPVNGVAKLTWRTSNAASVVLQPGSRPVDPNGSLYLQVPGTQVLTLIAQDAAGNPVSQQRTITADPSLQVNAETFDFDGTPGAPGTQGDLPFVVPGKDPTPGGNGSPGQSSTLRIGLLDLAGTTGLVRGAFARGGQGGQGGAGASGKGVGSGQNGARGGDGGSGGDLTVEFGAQWGPPGQLVVDVSGGAAGAGGAGGEGNKGGVDGLPGADGQAGLAGSVTFLDTLLSATATPRRLTPTRSATLLGYTLLEETDDGGMLTLTLSASGTAPDLQSIAVPLPLLSRPDGWTAAYDGAVTTLTPPAPLPAGGSTFTFAPAAVPPSVLVTETAGGQTRTALFTLDPPGSAP